MVMHVFRTLPQLGQANTCQPCQLPFCDCDQTIFIHGTVLADIHCGIEHFDINGVFIDLPNNAEVAHIHNLWVVLCGLAGNLDEGSYLEHVVPFLVVNIESGFYSTEQLVLSREKKMALARSKKSPITGTNREECAKAFGGLLVRTTATLFSATDVT